MRQLALLNADLEGDFPHVDEVKSFRLNESEADRFRETLPEADVLVADLNLVNVDSFKFLDKFSSEIEDRVREGALLLCYTSRPNLHSPNGVQNKYAWIPLFDPEKEIVEDLIDQIHASEASPEENPFDDQVGTFYATCSFPNGFGADAFAPLLEGDDGVPVALSKRLGKGLVLLVPQAENKTVALERVLEWWESGAREGPEVELEPPAPAAGEAAESALALEEVELETGEAGQSGEALELEAPVAPETEAAEGADAEAGSIALGGSEEAEAEEESIALGGSEEAAEPSSEAEAPSLSDFEPVPLEEEEDKFAAEAGKTAVAMEPSEADKVSFGTESSKEPGEAEAGKAVAGTEAESEADYDEAREELDALLAAEPEVADRAAGEAPASAEADLEVAGPPGEALSETEAPDGPEWLEGYKKNLPGFSKLLGDAERLESEAARLLDEARELREKASKYSDYDHLLYADGSELQATIVKLFRDAFGAEIEEMPGEPLAIRAGVGDHGFLFHLATATETLGADAGRELLRALADEDVDTKGILVVNGRIGEPPPSSPKAHVNDKLITLAEKRGLAVIPVELLHRAAAAFLQDEEWEASAVVEKLADETGLIDEL